MWLKANSMERGLIISYDFFFCFYFCIIFVPFFKKSYFGNNIYKIFLLICRCEPGLVPMPDSIEGCVECLINSDCDYGSICEVQWNKCIPKPDPCNPSPCGPGARCMEDHNGNAVCRFLVEK